MDEKKIKIWAKSIKIFKDDNGNVTEERIISLSEHISDVLKSFKHLNDFLSKRGLSNPLPDFLSRLIIKVIQYHDIAKVLPYFQIKIIKNKEYKPFDVYVNIPHSILSALMVKVPELKKEIEEIIDDPEKSETYTKYILSAIAYHHWRENFYDIVEGYTDVFEKLQQLISDQKKWDQIESNIREVYSELKLPETFKPFINERWVQGLNNGIRYADYIIPPYQLYRMPKRLELDSDTLKDWVLISGFTMLCDHFASYVEGVNEEGVSLNSIEIKGPEFEKIKEEIETELKSKIGDSYKASDVWQFNYIEKYKNDNAILLAPTGIGKTEFAYLWSNGEKFFYTLPLRTASNQIFNRTKTIFGKDNAGVLHSDADVFIFGDGAETESIRVYEMAKQLSSPAIISTGDQFFPYALRPPSYERIFAKFSYSRLIIDEVQAYDPKAAAIVVKFVEHIVQMGGKFLLMTATLPGFIREQIENRIGLKNENTLNLFEKEKGLQDFSKHKIELIIEPYKENKASYGNDIIKKIIDKAKENEGSRVLVVLNTVKQAQAVFDDLKKNNDSEIDIRLFHSRYTQKHRKEIEDNLNDFIGNKEESRNDKRAKILVATQVVEASLDLDADYLFTELSPWDSLIQRMGRVLRELRITSDTSELISRRYGKNTIEIPGNVFIMVYNGYRNSKPVYESSQGYVYHVELLRTTLKMMESPDEDLKKWNDGKKHDIKSMEKIKPFWLTEQEKSKLVERLFDGLPTEGKYLRSFYNMLQLLDSGFMSDRKNEAQKAFREINDVSVVADDKKEDFFQSLKAFNYSKKYAYTAFKKEIISRYLISVQRSKVKEYLYDSNLVINRLAIEDVEIEKSKLNKLKNWLYGIYFVPLDYSETSGLYGVKELDEFV